MLVYGNDKHPERRIRENEKTDNQAQRIGKN